MAEKIENKYKIPEGSLISYFSNKVKKEGGINFAQGIPGFLPPKELLDILKEVTHTNIHQYAPGNGNLKLLDLLSKKYSEFGIEKDNLLVTQGVTEAITLLYIYFKQIIKHDFSVLAIDPVYETYNNIPEIFGDRFIAYALNYEPIDFQRLEHKIEREQVKVLFLSSPGNPYGKVFSKSDIDEFIRMSMKYDFFIVFDAVYQDLYFKQKPYIPLDQFNDNFFYVNSFSKMLSITGWRIGYLAASNKHINQIKSIHDYTGLCAPSILQEAVSIYLEEYSFGQDYISHLREKLYLAFDKLSQALIDLNFEIPTIDGGYFVWAKLPEQFNDGFQFAVDLFENEKVAVIPGIHFSSDAQKYVRFNIAHNMDMINEGIQRIRSFVENAGN